MWSDASATSRLVSVFSIRRRNSPLPWRANSQLKSAVRMLPMWMNPVGLGAMRTRTDMAGSYARALWTNRDPFRHTRRDSPFQVGWRGFGTGGAQFRHTWLGWPRALRRALFGRYQESARQRGRDGRRRGAALRPEPAHVALPRPRPQRSRAVPRAPRGSRHAGPRARALPRQPRDAGRRDVREERHDDAIH